MFSKIERDLHGTLQNIKKKQDIGNEKWVVEIKNIKVSRIFVGDKVSFPLLLKAILTEVTEMGRFLSYVWR